MIQPGVYSVQAIHSGGQSGADCGGLAAAVVLGLRTGGWAPKGYRIDGGRAPWLAELGVREHSSSSYPPRTELNVKETDGTLIFGNIYSPGCSLTARLAKKHAKPLFHSAWLSGDPAPAEEVVEAFQQWLDAYRPKVLNVAGNRESTQPGIRDATRAFIVRALTPS